MTFVVSVVPLMTTTEDETNWLPFTVRRKSCCTSAKVIVVAESDTITGAGLALPHRGFSALQPGKNGKTSRSALSCRKETPIRFIRHRTPGSPLNLGLCGVTTVSRCAVALQGRIRHSPLSLRLAMSEICPKWYAEVLDRAVAADTLVAGDSEEDDEEEDDIEQDEEEDTEDDGYSE